MITESARTSETINIPERFKTPGERDLALQALVMAEDAGLIEKLALTPKQIDDYVKRRLNPSYHVGDPQILAGILTGKRRKTLMSYFRLEPGNTPEAETANTGSDHGARMRLLRQNRSWPPSQVKPLSDYTTPFFAFCCKSRTE